MRRRYVVAGTQAVASPDDGALVEPGGVVTADTDAMWTQMQVASGVLILEAATEEVEAKMPCPICRDQGKKQVPAFTTLGELEAHYTDRHAGFVVPAFEPKEA
jgi:hypothetical protein